MKFLVVSRLNRRHIVVLSAVMLFSFFLLTSEASAQRRRVVVERGPALRALSLPRSHFGVVVGGRHYLYSHGFFYRGIRRGYMRVPAPIGARIGVLPVGFVRFYVGALPYFYYGGTYYRYLPDESVYVVVEKPSAAPVPSNITQDVVVLTDGTSLSGVFVGATADTVSFQVNDQVRAIPITEITSITFAPSTFNGQK